jgi:site-specific DNA recombinase
MEQPVKRETAKPVRCAIYTRVSSDQGLEQDFNSLDNQREAAEAYIKSQAHEGWRCLPASYDDGGFSGGSMERPALRRLLDDIRARRIDVVVVYKVDRLTRSLADFAKLVELFDQHGVSFVSVTQAFNTTSSMGRLTLNVLLSFAQFEREVTAERIRDKIAASKRKGMRMGGPVPLGYDIESKRLVINEQEADRVRRIFRRYLELGCLTKLAGDLRKRGIFSKVTRRSQGASRGGIPFTKGPLAYLLKNRVYIGEIIHKRRHYPGEHEPILDRELFEAVQRELASRAQARGHHRINHGSLLTGRIFDDRGNRMTPSTGKKGSARYRYYVSAALLQGRREDAGSVPRVPAPDVEAAVLGALRQIADGAALSGHGQDGARTDRDLIDFRVDKIVVRKNGIEITPRDIGCDTPAAPIVLPWSPAPASPRREITQPAGLDRADQRPIRAESRARLLEGIAKARLWLDELATGRTSDTSEIARREGCSERSVRMTLSLAFLSPTIVQAAVDGTLPQGHGVSTLLELPADWQTQMRRIASTG